MSLEYFWTKQTGSQSTLIGSHGTRNLSKVTETCSENGMLTSSTDLNHSVLLCPTNPSTFGSSPTLPWWWPNLEEVVGVKNAVTYCRKKPGTSNQGSGPVTLVSCFVCVIALTEHLNWLGFCFGFGSPEALRKRALCKGRYLSRVSVWWIISSKSQKM